jgi:hypothetical protein
MRKIALVAVVFATACALPGQMRRKPGSNVVLPSRVGFVEGHLRNAACGMAKRDSIGPAAARGGTGAVTTVKASCSELQRPLTGQPAPMIPPR